MISPLLKPVKNFMKKRVVCVPAGSSLKQTFALFQKNKIVGAPVIDKSKKVVGMVTEMDLLENLTTLKAPGAVPLLGSVLFLDPQGFNKLLKKHTIAKVDNLMSKPVITLEQSEPLQAAIDLMASKHVNRLPIVDKQGKIVGLLARKDLLKPLSSL